MKDFWGIMFPKICPICKKIIVGTYICKECRKKLPYITADRCFKCGKQLRKEVDEYCRDCQEKQHVFTRGIAPFEHVGRLKDAVYEIKYDNKREYLDFFADEWMRQCETYLQVWKCEVIIPVPMYKKKQRKRGYNQAELFAKKLSKLTKIPIDANILERISDTKPQKQLDDVERKKNLENAFRIKKNMVRYNKVLLVDDIYTTGSTVDACSKVLMGAGAEEVYIACMTIGTGY